MELRVKIPVSIKYLGFNNLTCGRKLLESNIGIILKISKAYTNTAQDREDLINDIAFEMWKAFPNFKGNSKISTWVYRITLNTSMNYKRYSRKKVA